MIKSPMFRLTLKSSNHKTGQMPVSTSPHYTCPDACPFKGHGCYSEYGPIAIWWNACSKVKKNKKKEFEDFLVRVEENAKGKCWRHNQAGDLFPCAKNKIDPEFAYALMHRGKGGFTYTHYPVIVQEGVSASVAHHNRVIIETMNANDFSVSVSCNGLSHVDSVLDSGINAPLTTVLPTINSDAKFVHTPKGNKVMVCPSVVADSAIKKETKLAKKENRSPKFIKDVTCISCGLCMNPRRKLTIGFPAHGSAKKRCDAVIEKWESVSK